MQPYNFLSNYSIIYMKLPLIDIWSSIVDHSTKKKKKKLISIYAEIIQKYTIIQRTFFI